MDGQITSEGWSVLVAQHMLSSKRIVELINIDGNSFAHAFIILMFVLICKLRAKRVSERLGFGSGSRMNAGFHIYFEYIKVFNKARRKVKIQNRLLGL